MKMWLNSLERFLVCKVAIPSDRIQPFAVYFANYFISKLSS